MFATNHDLFDQTDGLREKPKAWKPHALSHEEWPPDYNGVYQWRIDTLHNLNSDPNMLMSAKAYYATRPAEFIMHWMDTYNPRKVTNRWMPFILFERQYEFIDFLRELDRDQENGLVEKCRDIGATWLACAYSVWALLFLPDDSIGWGSRKQELVDKIGDPDSIFEKMRLLFNRLPNIWHPKGFTRREHATFMKMINPEIGSNVTGESGDNIGRGGRKSRYFKDESAHYERAEVIQSALDDNTNVQIDMSSVNGLGNVFHRKREAGIDWQPGLEIEAGYTRVFIFDWRHHPEKDQIWYDTRKARAEREGMQHVFAQEVDRNYSAAVMNTIISYDYIQAAVDAHLKIPCLQIEPPKTYMAGLDVADEGMDRNALALRQWVILRKIEEWGERDTGVTTRKTIAALREYKGISIQYDSIGVGSGVKAEYNRLVDEGIVAAQDYDFVAWNAGASVVNPYENIIKGDDQSMINKDFYKNMKAQAWWALRTRFYKTWRAITFGDVYDPDELISLDSSMPQLLQLMKELAQPTRGESTGLRMIVNKTPTGTRSPNLADAVVQSYFPAPDTGGYTIVGDYNG